MTKKKAKKKTKKKKKSKVASYYVDDLVKLVGEHLEAYPMNSIEFYANQIINDAYISYQEDGFFNVEWKKD